MLPGRFFLRTKNHVRFIMN